MITILSAAKKLFFDVLFPPVCLGCAKNIGNDEFLCDVCRRLIVVNSAFFCPVCSLRLADNKLICHHDGSPRYVLGAATDYSNPVINNLIHYFKYEGFENLTPFLCEILMEYLANSNFALSEFVLLPMPLHKLRERQRGYNQSKLLADILSDKLKLKLIKGLKRIKNTKPQAKAKNIYDREKNISDCFKVANIDEIAGKNILLIDDVFTSGATMNEAVRVLRQSGARKIAALVIAKT